MIFGARIHSVLFRVLRGFCLFIFFQFIFFRGHGPLTVEQDEEE
jgi:hypothetical protein